MTPVEELSALYEQWRRLTEDEGRAIDGGDWDRVAQSQSGKTRLQPRIIELSQRLEASVHEAQFRPMVENLMEMERANRLRLQQQNRSIDHRRRQLDRATRNLRHLHQTYVPAARANWQSYS